MPFIAWAIEVARFQTPAYLRDQHQLDLALVTYASDNYSILPDSSTYGGSWWWDISLDVRDKVVAAGATLCNAAGNFSAVTGGWTGIHRTSHVQPGTFTDEMMRKPTGGNRLQGDGSVSWIPFAKIQARTTGNPQHWW